MRTSLCVLAALGPVVASALISGVGCGSLPDNCEARLTCPPAATSAGAGGGGGGTPAACIPSAQGGPIADSCGVFVSSSRGADGNDGTKGAPLKSLADAAGKAQGRAIYACAEAFTGSVTLAAGSSLYGGLDCTKEWAYIGATKKSELSGDADKPALVLLSTANGAKIEDFTITAVNATAVGGSSIAVMVDGATAELSRCELKAGDAMAGVAGEPYPGAAQAGITGLPGGDACSGDTVAGAIGLANMCGVPVSVGGDGGNGKTSSGSNGSNGQPGIKANSGTGEVLSKCTAGTMGDVGQTGMPGAGGTGLGTLDMTGYIGNSGTAGAAGGPGQGGGGGGGAKGGTAVNQCPDPQKAGGASGGSGGSGGCGGAGGKPGSAGGSSIGLLSLKANVSIANVTVSTGNGGAGGDGGDGQDGGLGAAPGAGGKAPPGLNPACGGGNGGTGGKGGNGGGGMGGHAIGIAYTGMAPATKGLTVVKGTAGPGGMGGNAGDPGVQANMQQFP